MAYIDGFLYGLATVILIGPVFFTLLKASLIHGSRGGVAVALGIIVSDILVVMICMTGASAFLKDQLSGKWVALAAGIILLLLGIRYIVSPKLSFDQKVTIRKRDLAGLFTSGFLVNFVNPFVFVIWIAFTIHAATVHGLGNGQWIFLAGVLSGIFSTDLLKAHLAQRLGSLLAPGILKKVYMSIGIVMIIFSLRAFYHAVVHWT